MRGGVIRGAIELVEMRECVYAERRILGCLGIRDAVGVSLGACHKRWELVRSSVHARMAREALRPLRNESSVIPVCRKYYAEDLHTVVYITGSNS